MSRTPRSIEADQSGNTDSQNERIETQAILDELDRLRQDDLIEAEATLDELNRLAPPEEAENPEERLTAEWRMDNIQRILTRLRATTDDIDHFLKDPQTIRLLSQDGSPEQREHNYAGVQDRAATLKTAIGMAKEDIQELIKTYRPGVDSDGLGHLIVSIKKQVELLGDLCNRF